MVALAPVCDLEEAIRLRLGSDAVRTMLGGTPVADADPMRLLHPGTETIIIHGVDDQDVPIELSRTAEGRASVGRRARGGGRPLRPDLPDLGGLADRAGRRCRCVRLPNHVRSRDPLDTRSAARQPARRLRGARPRAGARRPARTTTSGAGRPPTSTRSGSPCGSTSTSPSDTRSDRCARRRVDARRGVVPRGPHQLRRDDAPHARPCRRRRGRGGPVAEPRRGRPDRRRAARPGRPGPGRADPGRGRRGRPRGGVPPQHPRDPRAPARHRQPRRGLHVVRAGVRHPERHRPLAADRAQGAGRRGRLPVRRQADRPPRGGAGHPGRAAEPDHRRAAALPRRRTPAGDATSWAELHRRAGTAGVRPGAVRAPALHPVLLGHHRAAEADRARPRRHHRRAPQGPRPADGSRPRRPVLLVLHDRLDDVELPGLRARRRRRRS